MVADEKIRAEIKDRVEKIPANKLKRLLEYVKTLEPSEDPKNSGVLQYFGAWSDIDDDLFSELTAQLPERRLKESKNR